MARQLRFQVRKGSPDALSLRAVGLTGPFVVELDGHEVGRLATRREARSGVALRLRDGRLLEVRRVRHGRAFWELRLGGRLLYGCVRQQHRWICAAWLLGGAAIAAAELLSLAQAPTRLPGLAIELAANVALAALAYGRFRPVAWIGAALHAAGLVLLWSGFAFDDRGEPTGATVVLATLALAALRTPWLDAGWIGRVLRDLDAQRRLGLALPHAWYPPPGGADRSAAA